MGFGEQATPRFIPKVYQDGKVYHFLKGKPLPNSAHFNFARTL